VKKADGTLEARQVVVGVTDRVHGEVLEGLKEGEAVVVGKRQAETAATPSGNQNNRSTNGNSIGPPGGGGRPF
jgi:membrane fusion protein, macrolide-specific efflux system